ncbi:MAG: tetratricopeptide repeat protein [Cyanobacteria bacterium SZAS-4]|nr:tetratricopeptide repeat protein [Cyanobacteria bacterium SZAS-4]
MQDYLSSGFAPSFTNKFAPASSPNFAQKTREQSIHNLTQRPTAAQPTNRSQFISQQEKTIRNGFLRKTTSKSSSSLSKRSAGSLIQSDNCKAESRNSSIGLKLAASSAALFVILLAGQISCSFLSQQAAIDGHQQVLPKHSDSATGSRNSIANVRSSAIPVAATAGVFSNGSVDGAHKTSDLIAVAQASAALSSTEQNRPIKDSPAASSDHIDLTSITTSDLVKSGYQKLRSGGAQESIVILTEAVRRDSNDPSSRRYLGYALIQAGRPSEALAQYDALQKLTVLLPADRLAMEHAAHMQSQSASNEVDNTLVSKYRAAIASNPKDFDSKYRLAVICSKLGRTEEAIHECLTGMSESPSSSANQQQFYLLYSSLAVSNANRS